MESLLDIRANNIMNLWTALVLIKEEAKRISAENFVFLLMLKLCAWGSRKNDTQPI